MKLYYSIEMLKKIYQKQYLRHFLSLKITKISYDHDCKYDVFTM